MKKKIFVLFSLITCFFFLVGCEKNTLSKEEKKFQEEYEQLNGQKTESGKTNLPLDLDEKTNVQYKTASEIVELLKTGTGVIYLGFPECPWCRNALPVLLDVLEEQPFYYLNAKSIRDEKHLDAQGKIVVDQEGTKEYQEMLSLLNNYLPSYTGLNNKDIKRIYFPTVIFVKDGNILEVHTGTVESQKDPYQKLTNQQEEELEMLYENALIQLNSEVCDRNGC